MKNAFSENFSVNRLRYVGEFGVGLVGSGVGRETGGLGEGGFCVSYEVARRMSESRLTLI